jgi:peptidoglycan DL-endopeptidase CwlO
MRRALAAVAAALIPLASTVPARAANVVTRSPQAAAYAWAVAQAGKPFAMGADGPRAFDCSGLVYAAYRHAGITLPRDTYQMVNSRKLERISRAQAQRGDLAFYGPIGAPEHVSLIDEGNVVFSAYRPGQPAGWSLNGPWWSPSAWYRVRS